MPEFELDDQNYLRFQSLVRERYGLSYPEHKRLDLAQGVHLTSRDSGIADLDRLYASLLRGNDLWDTLITYLTIGETYFFRNEPQFLALRRHIIPDLIERRAKSRNIRIWSAGCATGEEPYSVAMLTKDLLGYDNSWHVSILATDINPAFMAKAQAALYGAWSFRETPAPLRERFFEPEENRWRLKPEIVRMVRFARLNLAEALYPNVINGTCAMDVILCRNVTIYFDEATTRAVAERMYHALTPGGWLIVGHSEPQISTYRRFEVHNFPDTVIYRKPLDAPIFFSAQGLPPSQDQPPTGIAWAAGPAPTIEPSPFAAPARQAEPPLRAAPVPATKEASGVAEPPADALDRLPLAEMLERARACANKGAWPEAADYCERMLKRDPLMVAAHYLSAQILEQQGQLDAALAAYRRTVYLDRAFVMGTLGMGHVWRKKGRAAEAQRCYRNVLEQLAALPGGSRLPGGENVTVGELIKAVGHLLG